MKIDGKKVVDARSPLKLEIIGTDISLGQTKDPKACAIARACKRSLNAKSARVHLSKTYVEFDNKWVRYDTPVSARTEIVSFDRGHKFEKGEFLFSPPRDSHKIGARQGSDTGDKRPRSEKRKGPKRKYKHVTGVRASALHNVWSKG